MISSVGPRIGGKPDSQSSGFSQKDQSDFGSDGDARNRAKEKKTSKMEPIFMLHP